LPRLASNHELPSLYLSSSWDYRCEPPWLAKSLFLGDSRAHLTYKDGRINILLLLWQRLLKTTEV
jgi:hypothetical protein